MKTQLKLLLCLVFLVSTLLSLPAHAEFTPKSGLTNAQGGQITNDTVSDGEFHKGVVDTPVVDDCDYTSSEIDGCRATETLATPTEEDPQAADVENSQEPSDESTDSDGADKAEETAAADEPDAADEADDADESTEAEDSGDADDDSDDE